MKGTSRVATTVAANRAGVWTVVLVTIFVVASIVYAVRGLTDLATAALGAATVIAGGGAATSAAEHRATREASTTNGDSEPASGP
jgi:hypothetical protein